MVRECGKQKWWVFGEKGGILRCLEREREGFWGRERELIIERQELVETGRRAHGWWGPFAYTYTAFTAHTHPLTPLVYFLCGVFVWWILKLFLKTNYLL
jgi:hypothetical protein